jgi:hypothetical protein
MSLVDFILKAIAILALMSAAMCLVAFWAPPRDEQDPAIPKKIEWEDME